MGRELKQRLFNYLRVRYCDDTEQCSDLESRLSEAIAALSTAGVTLTSVHSSFSSSREFWDTGVQLQTLARLIDSHHIQGQHIGLLDDPSRPVLSDAINQSSRDQDNNRVGPTALDSTPPTAAGAWSLTDTSTPEQDRLLWSLQLVRHLLVLTESHLQPSSLLGQPRIKRALQDLLPFLDYQRLAVDPHPADNPLVHLLPAALRAWLLADVAAGLLLADQSGGRYQLPHSPQHHAAFLMLFQQQRAGQQQQLQLKIVERFQNQQTMYRQFEALCQRLVPKNGSSNSSQSPAAALVRMLQLLLLSGSCSNGFNGTSRNTLNVLLPHEAAAWLADEINHCSGGSSADVTGTWRMLHLCLSSMSVALLLELQQNGRRLRLPEAFLDHQQVQLQSLLMRMLAPVQQEAMGTAEPAATAHQQQQQQQPQHNSDIRPLVADSQLDGAVLQCMLTRVQAFIAAVHTAKKEQRQQVMEQLKHRLAVLHGAVTQEDHNTDQDSATDGSSNSSSAARQCRSQELTRPQQLVTSPDMAELIGLGNLEQLLQLQIHHAWQCYPLSTAKEQECTRQRLLAAPVGARLKDFKSLNSVSSKLTARVECSANPQLLLHYWRARAQADSPADAAADVRWDQFIQPIPGSWQHQQLASLLRQHGGFNYDIAQDFAQTCLEMSRLLAELDWAAVHVQGRDAVYPVATLMRTAGDARSSDGSSSSSEFGPFEVLPGYWYHTIYQLLACTPSSNSSSGDSGLVDRLAELNNVYGPLATYGLASLLVRTAISQLPGQRQQQPLPRTRSDDGLDTSTAATSNAVAAAAAASIDKQELHGRLRKRLSVLKKIARAFRLAQLWSRCSGDGPSWQQWHSLSNILADTAPSCSPIIEKLATLHNLHLKLMRPVLDASGVLQRGAPLPAGAVGLSEWSKLQVFELLVKQLSQHCCTDVCAKHLAVWGSSSSGSVHSVTYSSSSNGAGALAEGGNRLPSSCQGNRASSSSSTDYSSNEYGVFCDGDAVSSFSVDTISSDDSADDSSTAGDMAAPEDIPALLSQLSTNVISLLPDLLNALETVIARAACQIMSAARIAQQAADAALQVAAQLDAACSEAVGWLSLTDKDIQREYDSKLLERMQSKYFNDYITAERSSYNAAHNWQEVLDDAGELAGGVLQLLKSCGCQLHSTSSTEQQQQQWDGSGLAWRVAALCNVVQLINGERLEGIAAPARKARFAAEHRLTKLNASTRSRKGQAAAMRAITTEFCAMTNVSPVEQAGHSAIATAGVLSFEAAAAAGLGLLACMGLWVVPEWGPGPSMGTSGDAGVAASAADKQHMANGQCSSRGLPEGSTDDCPLLQAVKELDQEGVDHVANLLAFISGASSSSTNTNSDASAAVDNSDEEQLSGHRCRRTTTPGSDTSSSNCNLAATRLAGLVQDHYPSLLNPDAPHSSAAEGGCRSALAFKQAVWHLLSALKPSVARALHFQQLPPACRTHDNFQAAVYAWPPERQQQQCQQQQHASSGSSGKCKHSCRQCGQAVGIPCQYYTAFSEGSWTMLTSVVCTAAGCVVQELQQRVEAGPPAAVMFADSWRELFATSIPCPDDTIPQEFRHLLTSAQTTSNSREAATCQQQQQQYARALQVSLCKSGSPTGLVRRLLLLEAIRHPGEGSLLHLKLLPAWREQHSMELSRVLVPQGFNSRDAAAAATAHEDLQGVSCSSSSNAQSPGSNISRLLSTPDPDARVQTQQDWHPQIYSSLEPIEQLLEQDSARSDIAAEAAAVDYARQYAEMCCFSAASRRALCCWVLCWHCCVRERGGGYDCTVTRAAAAEAASDSIGADELQHIRLPAWANILPPPAAAAAATTAAVSTTSSNHLQPPVWWHEPVISTTTSPGAAAASSSPCSNERWCHALYGSGGAACQGLCDHCGVSLADVSSSNETTGRGPRWCCPGCGVAVYCSRSCADKDRSNHKRVCSRLVCLSGAAGYSKDWETLAADAATAAPRRLT